MADESTYDKVYTITRTIPPGKVMTYGQIARMVDRCTARMVGFAMAGLADDSDVPWHRVINSQGKVSQRKNGNGDLIQVELLKAEGVYFNSSQKVDLKSYQWTM